MSTRHATDQSPSEDSDSPLGVPSTTADQSHNPSHAPVADRIFPVSSLLSLNPAVAVDSPLHTQDSTPLSPGGSARRFSIIDSDTWSQLHSQSDTKSDSAVLSGETRQTPGDSGRSSHLFSEASSIGPESSSSGLAKESALIFTPSSDEDHKELVTSRFRHIVTDDGHAVVTGRTVDSFKACEDEPIHIPGAVQSFGVLIALRQGPEEKLTVRIASENSEAILGYSPSALFSLDSFCDILPDDQADTFLDNVDFVQEEGYDPSVDGPEVFILTISQPGGGTFRVWCAIHINPANNGLIVCEFELEDDHTNPLRVSGSSSPAAPSDTLGATPTPEQLAGSTVTINQPLRVLRRARRRKGEAAAMEVFSIVSQIQEQLARAESMQILLDITAGLVKELTGFHRVLVYQFDSEFNGKVVAELVDPTMSIDLYKGLHFPAADIPKQARDLYHINKVRLLYDRDQVTARLVCRTLQDLETPLDMTYGYLRAMSPIHIKYLANMAVRSSMSISVNGSTDLWGLISCHSYGAKGMRVPFPVRKMCRLIGDTVARNIERLSYASRLQARKLINTVATDANPSGYIVASSDDLLRLFDADYGALCIRGETKILAKSPQSQEMLALLEYLKVRHFKSVLTSSHIVKDFRDLQYPPGFKDISGMLYVPLSTDGRDFIVFFRRGQLTEVKWGGNPHEAKFTDGHLEPRKSFQTWRETVLDRSREWTDSEVDTAAVLCLVYGKFIKVWRQQEAALEGSSLTKLLLANSAHEVRTPLNAIVNYLEIALEGALDSETRDHVTKSYSASKSLIYVINDLLDLTNVEKGQELIKDEPFDLKTTFEEATSMFDAQAKRKQLKYTVLSHPGIPDTVVGDQRRVRQAISNIISNAIQHTSAGGVTVEMWRAQEEGEPGKATVKIAVLDTGPGIPSATLEILFHELEQVSAEDDSYYFTDNASGSSEAVADRREKNVLGLGLALVARIVRNMHGQLSVNSEEGKGSRFQVSLQFPIPEDAQKPDSKVSQLPIRTRRSVTAFPSEDDMILVDSTSSAQRQHGQGSGADGVGASAKQESIDREPQSQSRESVDAAPSTTQAGNAPLLSVQQQSDHVTSKPEAGTLNTPSAAGSDSPTPAVESKPQTLRVLVAEDDPINGKILQKRLGKLGHTVRLTVNGEDCAITYCEDPMTWDVVLMDMQMPILDGIDSTKRIRLFENGHSDTQASPGMLNRRVPIFAVSASLVERDAQMCMDVGFDGWIMKPINFARLNVLLDGIHEETARSGAVYQPGRWEHGGWFTPYRGS